MHKYKEEQIYLDYAATTPCDDRVLLEMFDAFKNNFGNPNSLHKYGENAMTSLSIARSHVCNLLNVNNHEIMFTSGATESINIAISRSIQKLSKSGKNHLITFKTEHKATIDSAKSLERSGMVVDILGVTNEGLINFDELEKKITSSTAMISVCYVNNETGVLQDAERLVALCRKYSVLLHLDATQALGKIPIDLSCLDVDMLSASGHKIYGPKGIGILFCRKKHQSLIRMPLGNLDVEYGIRSGTPPVPLCVGLGEATKIAKKEMSSDLARITDLRNKFISGITSQIPEIYINGCQESNYPGIINMSFRGCEGEALMMEANKIAIASGSACTSNKLTISHVLDAMGVKHDIAQSSLRISIGKYTNEQDIDIAIDNLVNATKKLRSISPVWDMIQEGVDLDEFFKDSIDHHNH